MARKLSASSSPDGSLMALRVRKRFAALAES
jgi:hypothetical protein